MHRHLFNDRHWQSNPRAIAASPQLKQWLFYPDSLTQRLRLSFGPIVIQVIRDELSTPLVDEKTWLTHPRQPCRIREVLLCQGQKPLVFAHSMIPLTKELSRFKSLAKLGNQPLGQWLFQQQQMKRGLIAVKHIRVSHPLYQRIPGAQQPQYWARRSWFQVGHEGLLVSEVFLEKMPHFNA
ncbi:MAG: hypothetical protein B7Z60_06280 [Ferrovum sp. 37-45-19]|jgi:chorismate--pyruvate lyase|uniref:chorismate--pyruvate lyase family protein n=1 Tax=Ferrovum sp. JA12 TaxID=1356299 RepID=UPI0007028585|nr:chorismate lyase [Ferrovum sp. JA12]OYV79993.1 MAG: hypothetical protein B7Z65_04630 [Ferrovum sp. 21-44-67]OYV94055.1 MAG: hypothetical protein B7Z60_06280 [Ferrovum sp. 37-45-19]OZB33945.1 MAG: hypothetical protein B7X47_02215 [Ferrovum sp. 34-44-207]HQT82329.1 chorismate lyase [Ferrovaceae bacterium]KRH78304.1 chorismate pyruvate-lyase [Ferrovum sp. JA12]